MAQLTSTSILGNLSVSDNADIRGEVTAGVFNCSSDARLKENIREFSPDHSICELPIYTYNFLGKTDTQIGCLAQDLQKLYPELVIETPDNYLAIRETKLIYLLLHEIKLLKEELNNIKDRGQHL